MATLQDARANMHCRKRSFDIALENEPDPNLHPHRHIRHGPSPRSMSFPLTSIDLSTPKRRFTSIAHTPSMPVQPSTVMSTNYPSFMSVYGSEDNLLDTGHVEIPQVSQKEQELPLGQSNYNTASRVNHMLPSAIYHRGSITSLTTASTASSPATTHSSPLFTDPSPSSSPESASSNPPHSIFKNTMQSSNHDRPWTGDRLPSQHQFATSDSNLRSESPNDNAMGRNSKNLSINMSAVMHPRPATSSGLEGRQIFSEPTSPFKETPRSGRKKPTNLTIRTPGFNQLSFARTVPDVPPTPSSKPSLQTFQSSPSLSTLLTPTTSSSAGLHLSLPSLGNGHSRPGSDSSFSSQSVSGLLPGLREEEEAHKSQETQERGYPDGPVLIYNCGLYLYLEPTAEEANKFDTVINVAKEVKNPFENATSSKTVVSVMRAEADRPVTPEPQTAISEMSFKSAWEFQPIEAPTPTTPRPDSSLSRREPEYLHVEWDHNSEILQDLFPLCQLIDERVEQGKKVLVHCQLGVSRSASLVIAFGLYKGYQPDFHSMYMQVKARSQWVGPNMSLIYQLTDFRQKVLKGDAQTKSQALAAPWFQNSPVTAGLKTPFQSLSLQGDGQSHWKRSSEDSETTPQTVRPLRSLRLDKELPPVPLFPKDEKSKAAPHIVDQYAKPPDLPEAIERTVVQTTSMEERASLLKGTVEPRPLPFRKLAGYSNPQSIPPHRPRQAVPPGLHIERRPSQMDLASQDVPQTPSLFSPRATEFMSSPFGISSSVGELAFNGPKSARSVRSIGPLDESIFSNPIADTDPVPSTVDPRSPHQQADSGEILRHIDDFL